MRRSLFPIALSVILLVSRHGMAEDALALTFAWPDIVRATVTVEISGFEMRKDGIRIGKNNLYTGKGRIAPIDNTATYRLEVSPAADGTLVKVRRLSFVEHTELKLLEALLHSEQLVFQYIVSRGGKFVDLHDPTGMHCENSAIAFGKSRNEIPPFVTTCRNQIDPRLIEILLPQARQEAFKDWERIVGFWLGLELVQGKTYEFATVVPEGAAPETGVPISYTIRYIGKMPCETAEQANDCVRLERLESTDTGTEFRPVYDSMGLLVPDLWFYDAPAKEKVHPTMGTLRRWVETRILANADNLLPRWVEEIETFEFATSADAERPMLLSRQTRTTWTYQYEVP